MPGSGGSVSGVVAEIGREAVEDLIEVGIHPCEAGRLQDGRAHSRRGGELGRHLAQNCAQCELRRRHHGWAAHRATQRLGDTGLAAREWRREVDRSRDVRVVDEVGQRAHFVTQADPAPPLTTGAQRAEHAKLGRKGHLGEGPALCGDDERRAGERNAVAVARGPLGTPFPVDDEVGQEVRPG